MDWVQMLTAGGAIGAFGTAIATWVRTRPAMKLAEIQGEAALWARIEKVEAAAEAERKSCDERIGRLEERHAAAIAEVRKELTGEVQILRHERNNIKQAMTFLLTSIRKIDHPALQAIATEAEEMLKRGDQLIALEKGAQKA
jgi:hypothetical protein